MIAWIILILVVVGMYFLMTREGFVDYFDKTQVQRTVATQRSSYAQQTNHMVPAPGPSVPIQGLESPFRVNMFDAYIP